MPMLKKKKLKNTCHAFQHFSSKKTQHLWQTAVNDTRKLVNGISNLFCPKCCFFTRKVLQCMPSVFQVFFKAFNLTSGRYTD